MKHDNKPSELTEEILIAALDTAAMESAPLEPPHYLWPSAWGPAPADHREMHERVKAMVRKKRPDWGDESVEYAAALLMEHQRVG